MQGHEPSASFLSTEIRAEAELPLDADALWRRLASSDWSWSRMMVALGSREAGGRSVLRLRGLPGGIPIPVKILVVEPGREIRWRGGIPLVFTGEHYFRLTPAGEGTRVEHGEVFRGVIGAPLMRALGGIARGLYRRDIKALAKACA